MVDAIRLLIDASIVESKRVRLESVIQIGNRNDYEYEPNMSERVRSVHRTLPSMSTIHAGLVLVVVRWFADVQFFFGKKLSTKFAKCRFAQTEVLL